jgi:competence protein ComGF
MNKFKDKNDFIDNETIVSLVILIILSFATMIMLFTLRNF